MDCGVSLFGWGKNDYEFFRDCLYSINGYTLCGNQKILESASKQIPHGRCHVAFIDIDSISTTDFSFIPKLQKINRQLLTIIVSDKVYKQHVFNALSFGANGWICKPLTQSLILMSLEEVTKGGAPLCPKVSRLLVDSFRRNPDSPLSKRETEVLVLLSRGMTYRRIANNLYITTETAKSHIKKIYSKLKVNSRADALQKAMDKKVI